MGIFTLQSDVGYAAQAEDHRTVEARRSDADIYGQGLVERIRALVVAERGLDRAGGAGADRFAGPLGRRTAARRDDVVDHDRLRADVGEREEAGHGTLGDQHVAEIVHLLIKTNDVGLLVKGLILSE